MKNIIVIAVIVCGIGYFAYRNVSSEPADSITINEDEVIIKRGDNVFTAEIISEYDEYLRVFGLNRNNENNGWSPVAYVDYFFVVSTDIVDAATCEARANIDTTLMNMVVNDQKIIDAIKELENTGGRRTATIIGQEIYIKKYLFKGEDVTETMKKQGKVDPKSAVLIKEIVL